MPQPMWLPFPAALDQQISPAQLKPHSPAPDMQTKLATLRSQLGSLRQKRAAVRWGSALCAPLAVVLWLLVAAFLCDWSFDLPVGLRAVSLLAWIAGGIWAVKRFAWPLVKVRESEQDVALIVEQHHKAHVWLIYLIHQ